MLKDLGPCSHFTLYRCQVQSKSDSTRGHNELTDVVFRPFASDEVQLTNVVHGGDDGFVGDFVRGELLGRHDVQLQHLQQEDSFNDRRYGHTVRFLGCSHGCSKTTEGAEDYECRGPNA